MSEHQHDPGPCDEELLGRYLSGGAPDAFADLVRRHVDFVYSTARRQVRDRHLAEDVTQNVFLLLIRKASALSGRRTLGGWLFHAALLESRGVLKKRSREARRIEKLAEQSRDQDLPMQSEDWNQIEPHLNEALQKLSDADREAVVLRYLQRRSYDWIAATFQVSEAAARQRVHRALERLRQLLSARGVVAGSTALATALKLNAVHPAPAGLAAKTVAAAAQLSSSAAGATVSSALVASIKSKAIAAILILGSTAVATATVIAIARHRSGSDTLYADPQSGTTVAARGARVPLNPGVRRSFEVVRAVSFDGRKGTRPWAGFIGYINRGDWLRFNRVDLGPPGASGATFSAVVSCPDEYAGTGIEVVLDSLTGPVLGTLKVTSTGGYGNWRTQSIPLAGSPGGVHDLFLRFTGGGWNFDTFKITLPTRPGTAIISAVSFNEASGVQTLGGVVCETADGYWVRYDGLDFGSGVRALALTYACDDSHAGGRIIVHLDSPEGRVIGQMPVASTGDWGNFDSALVPLETVTGSHNVVLVFSGQWHGIADLLRLQFLEQDVRALTRPATAPSTRPAGTTQPATREE